MKVLKRIEKIWLSVSLSIFQNTLNSFDIEIDFRLALNEDGGIVVEHREVPSSISIGGTMLCPRARH